MRSRRKAREAALQALYQCDTVGEWTETMVDLYFQVFQAEVLTQLASGPQENYEFARSLILGVIQHQAFIDEQISNSSTRWSLNRMSRVDRNILRIAAFELAFVADIPSNVSINEAIEIAKRFGTDDSPMFVNGVLDHLASELVRHPELIEQAVAEEKEVVSG